MKHISVLTLLSSIITVTLTNCNYVKYPSSDHTRSGKVFTNSLVEKYSRDSMLVISLPKNYTLKASQGIDFDTYYFSSSNKNDSVSIKGGIYLGNYPHYFTYEHCASKEVNTYALGEPCVWQMDSCSTKFHMQAIVAVKNNTGWNKKIHLFGLAYSKNDVNKLLDVFGTLKVRSKNGD